MATFVATFYFVWLLLATFQRSAGYISRQRVGNPGHSTERPFLATL